MSVLFTEELIVNRDLNPQQMFDDTGRVQYTDTSLLEVIPRCGSGINSEKVTLFELGQELRIEEIMPEFLKRGLIPDPYAQIQFNLNHPDSEPNMTLWQDDGGEWCYLTFCQRIGKPTIWLERHWIPRGPCRRKMRWDSDWLCIGTPIRS